MQATVHTLSRREPYTPSAFTRFLWWLSTAESDLLKECTSDRNRYAITGLTVLCTWLFATLAWTYFFSTVVSSLIAAILLGLVMGFIILCIDRALIKGINAGNRTKIIPLLFRAALAITIGTFMAQPALLYLFDKEVHMQISLDNEQKKQLKAQQLDSLYAARKNEMLREKALLETRLNERYAGVSAAREAFIAETDGTGGSGKIGLKDIAKAKQNEYTKLDQEYTTLQASLRPRLTFLDSSLNAIETAKQAELAQFNQLLNDGFLVRIEALQHLVENNSAMAFRYYLLVVLLVLIELMPVIAKSILPSGAYDEKVRLIETMEKATAASNTQKEQELKELYNQLAFEEDSSFIHQFFSLSQNKREEKMMEQLQRWKKDEEQSFDAVWVNLKKDFLSKQEN